MITEAWMTGSSFKLKFVRTATILSHSTIASKTSRVPSERTRAIPPGTPGWPMFTSSQMRLFPTLNSSLYRATMGVRDMVQK